MNKYSVEYNDETRQFEVVEWSIMTATWSRVGTTVAKFSSELDAVGECEILNVGYEYEMSEITSSEWDTHEVSPN